MLTKAIIERYFLAEKNACLLLLILGSIMLVASIIIHFTTKSSLYKGIALGLAIIAVLQAGMGYYVYNKSDTDRKQMVYAFDMNPDVLKQKEWPRMQQVQQNFKTLMIVQAVLMLIAVVVILVFKNQPHRSFWLGLAIGLLVQLSVVFLFDGIASTRANMYADALKKFVHAR